MPLVLKRWSYESCEFCVNCILEIYGILDMPQALNITRFWMYQESWYARFSQGILTVFLIYLGSWICHRVLNIFWKQLWNTFKFKYPGETLKNKIFSKCIWPETWILFLVLNNIHSLPVFVKSLRNNALPTTLFSSLQYFLQYHQRYSP